MNELIARLAALFVEPRIEAPAARRAARDRRACAAAAIVVLGDARAARAGVAVAAALARTGRAPCALLCIWGSVRPAVALPPYPAAAAAAAKLRARGHEARAGGRVVSLALAGDENDAVAEATRACAAVTGRHEVPTVLALCGARGAALDARIAAYDVALVVSAAGADPLLAEVAVSRVAARHPGVRLAHAEVASGRFAPPPRGAARAALEALR